MFFDVNISIGNWPFRTQRFSNDTEKLFQHLKKKGIQNGIVRHSLAPFNPDLESLNNELKLSLKPGFIPAFTVHPDYTFWHDLYCTAAVLFPSYHKFSLTARNTLQMADFLAQNGTVLHIVIREEDERNQHPCCRVPAVSMDEVFAFVNALPNAKIVLLNASAREIDQIREYPQISADIAYYEPFEPDENLSAKLLFGSHTPFYYTQAAINKIECCMTNSLQQQAIRCSNAKRLYPVNIQ